MEKGLIQVFCGNGDGKSSAALGKAVLGCNEGKKTIIVKFMKRKDVDDSFLKRLEPELKMFRFEKNETAFLEMSEDERKEEITNIRNGLNYAKKVLTTGECDVLILDEVLGLIDEKIISEDELIPVLEAKSDDTSIILTGITLTDKIKSYVDYISVIEKI